MTVQELKTHLSALPESDRADLADFLLDSLETSELEIEPEFEAELDRRVADYESGKDLGRPVDDVIAELREKYS